MFCSNCGSENSDSNKFCLKCGQPLVASVHPASTHPSSVQPRRIRRLSLILGGLLLLVALAAAAYFLLPRLLSGPSRRTNEPDMLLATPNRDGGSFDLSVLQLGDEPENAVVIAEGVISNSIAGNLFTAAEPAKDYFRTGGGPYGDFSPGFDLLVFSYDKGGETFLMQFSPDEEAAHEILRGEEIYFSAWPLPNSKNLFVLDYTGGSMICYLVRAGQEAKRVARGDFCTPTDDGRHIITADENSRGELTVTVADSDGENETTLLDDVEATGGLFNSFIYSADVSHIAYKAPTEQGLLVAHVLDAAGETVFTSDAYEDIRDLGFAGRSNTLYLTAVNANGEVELVTSAGENPLAVARSLSVMPAPDGSTLAVLTTGGTGANELTIHSLTGGEPVVAITGVNLHVASTTDPARLLVREEVGELTLSTTDFTGTSPVTLFDDNDYDLEDVMHLPGDDNLFLTLMGEDGYSLFVAPLDDSPGFFIIEDWHDFQLLNLSGNTLLFSGREDERDESILYTATLEAGIDPVEVDDSADSYESAVFAPDGRTAIYNAIIGDDSPVVRQARLDGRESPEELYDGVLLVAARWAEIAPFHFNNRLAWADAGDPAPQPPAVTSVEETTGNGIEELRDDVFREGSILANTTYDLGGDGGSGYGKVFTFDGESGQTVRIEVMGGSSIASSSLDPVATLLDENLNFLVSDDDSGNDSDALIVYTLPQDGSYFLVVKSYSGTYGTDNEMAYQVWMNFE